MGAENGFKKGNGIGGAQPDFSGLLGLSQTDQSTLRRHGLNNPAIVMMDGYKVGPLREKYLGMVGRGLSLDELSDLKTPESLQEVLRKRGFLRGDDFMIFNGDDIGGFGGFIGNGVTVPRYAGGGLGAEGSAYKFPSMEVRKRIWNATGVMFTPDFGGPSEWTDEGYTFTDLSLMAQKAPGLPFCDVNMSQEPVFGSCSGVLYQQQNGEIAYLTAKHCTKVFVESGKPTFAFFDYDDQQVTLGVGKFTSRNFAELDLESVTLHPTLDIALVGLDWKMGAPPEPVTMAQSHAPFVGQQVGSIGYPLGRPRKQVFGPGVTVGRVEGNVFNAFIDSFAVSSGSPVFTREGHVLGVLSHQEQITDFLPDYSAVGKGCSALAVVSRIEREGPSIIRVQAID